MTAGYDRIIPATRQTTLSLDTFQGISKPERMTPEMQELLDKAVKALRTELGGNLYSCCLYGSAVRGNLIKGVSDINLLIIVNESNSIAHEAISRAIGGEPKIDPFVLAKSGLARSFRAFAPKFASIKRNYRVLVGADPLAEFGADPQLEKFLCEQSLRNLRLRQVYSFVTRQRHKSYDAFVIRNTTPLFVQLSEVLRLNGISVPTGFDARIPVLEKEFKVDGGVLRDLLSLKSAPRRLTETEIVSLHAKLFTLVDTVIGWIESHWQT
jgi:predicted nucleotidyltransferase